MSETSDDYVPEADEMILAYAVYKDSRDMQKYKYDIDAGVAEWERIRNKAYAEANRFIEFVKQEAYDEGYEGVDVTEERIIALLDNADFLYFVWCCRTSFGISATRRRGSSRGLKRKESPSN